MIRNEMNLTLDETKGCICQLDQAEAYLIEARILVTKDNQTFADIGLILRKIQRLQNRLRKQTDPC
jgi:hypothetical protein